MEPTYRLEMVQGENFFAFPIELLVGKYINERQNEAEIVASVVYGTKSNLNRYERKSSTGYLVREDGLYSPKNVKFNFNPSLSSYNEVKGEYYSRLTTVKKKNGVIDETIKNNPIIILRESEIAKLPFYLYEYVRDNVVSGLYPNVLNAAELAGDLRISILEAEDILKDVDTRDNPKSRLAKKSIKNYYTWVTYLYAQMSKLNYIKELEVFVAQEKIYAYELDFEEVQIRKIISTGLRTSQIAISEESKVEKQINNFDAYIPEYAQSFKSRIEAITRATHYLGDVSEETIENVESLGRIPYPIQLDAIEAGLKSLHKQDKVIVVGEPGIGKTYIMSVQAYLDAKRNGKTAKILTFSPDHLIHSSWEEEITTTFGNKMKAHIIKSVKDLQKLDKQGFLNDSVDRMFILPQGAAKNGYSKKPAVIWSKKSFKLDEQFGETITKNVFTCPNCGSIQTTLVKNPDYKADNGQPKYITIPVKSTHYTNEKNSNKYCTNSNCGCSLWTVNNKKAVEHVANNYNKGFIYTGMGFLPNDLKELKKELADEVQKNPEKPSQNAKSLKKAILEIESGENKKAISVYKVPIADYIFKKCKNKFTHLILDEIHEVQNASARTAAAAKLVSSVPKIIGGTGTLMNGYAKSLFGMFYMLFPSKMKEHGYQIDDAEKFQAAYGVTEKTFRINEKTGARNSVASKSKPGISPVIFPLFLQEFCVFVSFEELKIQLPDLKNVPVPVEMTPELKVGKNTLERAVADATKGDLKLFKTMLPLLTSYLDSPSVEKEVKDEFGNVIYKTKALNLQLDQKFNKLLEIMKNEIIEKENRAIIYTYYTSDGINDYLKAGLESEGYKVCILNKASELSIGCDGETEKVDKADRQYYVKQQVKKGCQILITNPELVKTGTNLIDFAPIVRYQMDYKVYTERQSKGRTRRIGQTKPVNIYYLYYKDSMQEEINKIMATKVIASESIEGKMDSKGLDAMSNARTPEEEIGKRFFEKMSSK